MLRSHLINWLLTTRTLCWLGLHMPVGVMAFDEATGRLVDGLWECAACDKSMRSPRA